MLCPENGSGGISVGLDSEKTILDTTRIIDEWGITRTISDDYPMAVGYPIKDMEDFKNFSPPEPLKPYRFNRVREALAAFGKENCVIVRVRDVVSQPRDLMGFENFLAAFYEDPELVN